MKSRPRTSTSLLVLVLVAMINLPAVHGAWTGWRVAHSGVEVTATVTGTGALPPRDDPSYFVAFRLPRDVDPHRTIRNAEVDRSAYERAGESRRIAVRVLPDRPAAYRVEGEVRHRAGLVVTLAADLVLLGLLLLLWRFRGRLRPQLVAVATGDVEPCAPGYLLERLEGDLYVMQGEVAALEDDHVVLDLGGRTVRVALDGHANPVGREQPAQVRGRLVG